MRIITLTLLAILAGCATTDQGKSIERAQYADMGSTAAALAQGAVEMNPLGPALLVIKPLLASTMEKQLPYCGDIEFVRKWGNGFTYAAVGNNLAIAAGMSNPITAGVLVGAAYLVADPEKTDCRAPADVAITVATFADMYNAEDAASVAALFTEEAVTPTAHHRGHIEHAYQKMFEESDHRIQDIDGPWLHRDGYVTWLQFEDGLWYEWLIQMDGQQIAWSGM